MDAATLDLRAVQAMGAALDGSGKSFVVTSGTLFSRWPRRDAPGPKRMRSRRGSTRGPEWPLKTRRSPWRSAGSARRSSGFRRRCTVRADAHGFVPRLIAIAREKGVSAYVGDGSNGWPAVHELDAARLYRLALETAPAGMRWHGAADEGIPFRDIAGAIGRHLNLPAVAIPADQADAHFGFLGGLVTLDNPTSSALTQQLLGWRPVHPGLIADLGEDHYFKTQGA